jgi:3-deoxy-7-phosphoheptulonate synthase
VGFKNGTDGNIRIAVDAIKAAASRHHFISVTKSGHVAVFKTAGNEDCHVILRGGKQPNYDATHVEAACRELAASGLRLNLMVDFSHANSSKQFQKQLEVGADVAGQLGRGERRIVGVMIESHLNAGRQDLAPGKPLEYGVSITDACLGWSDTVKLLDVLAEGVRRRRLAAEE